eukprot:scaffold13203_cov140-Skeletonema_marinoi.AAC.4
MYFLRLLCGFSLLLSFSASGMPLKQQSLLEAGFGVAPNNDVIHLEDSDDEVESLQPIAPRPRGVDSNPLVRPVEEGLQEVRNVRPREEDPDPAEWNILQYIGVDSVRDLPRYLLNARANNLIGPMVEVCDAFQQLRRHRFIKEGNIPRNLFSPDGWLPYLGSGKVLAVLNFIGDTRSNPRAVNGNSDGTFVEPCLETIIKVFAAIFAIFGVEISVARIIARCIIVFANQMPFGKCRCCSILTILDIVSFFMASYTFFRHQPLDGRYDWHSRARRSFVEVAGVTDPLQRAVIQHVLRNCINITHAIIFGRPSYDVLHDGSWWQARNISILQATILHHPACVLMGWITQEACDNWVNTIGRIVAELLNRPFRGFTSEEANRIIRRRPSYPRLPPDTMTLGAYMTGNGYHVALDPDVCDVLVQYGNGEERSSAMHVGSLLSAQAAAERDTLSLFGEYACNSCRVKNVNGEWIRALDYGLNTGGSNNICARRHIGPIGNTCQCYCSGTKQAAGTFVEGFDRLDYPLQDAPPTILSYQTRISDHGIVASFIGAKALALHLHPIQVQMIENTSAVEVKQSYPWAFGSKGALFGVATLTKALTREMIESPNRPIIVGESAYKMRPWDLTR